MQNGRPRDFLISDKDCPGAVCQISAKYSSTARTDLRSRSFNLLRCFAYSTNDATVMFRLFFVTKYIDHILYFFLEELRQEVELTIVVDQKNDWTRKLQSDNVDLHHLTPASKFDSRYRAGLDQLAGVRDPDLIQCFHGNAELANVIHWNRGRRPLVAYRARIGHLKFRENPMAYWNVRNPSLTAVAAVSSRVRVYLESFRFLSARNVRVMPHGINRAWAESQTTIEPALREQLAIDENALLVASVAALRPVKRFDYIVHAAERLRDEPVHFVHAGAPGGWDEECSHLPKVHFLGQLANPFPLLGAADVFAMTSHNEAFGRANLEAMALGKPVIGSNTGGLLDLVVPGVTGQLFETASRDEFAECVRRYLADRSLVAEHGKNAIDRVDRLFTSKRMSANYLDLYREVLAGTAGAR
jgi:glycosyltransferase involved in cell wall biosynthesis